MVHVTDAGGYKQGLGRRIRYLGFNSDRTGPAVGQGNVCVKGRLVELQAYYGEPFQKAAGPVNAHDTGVVLGGVPGGSRVLRSWPRNAYANVAALSQRGGHGYVYAGSSVGEVYAEDGERLFSALDAQRDLVSKGNPCVCSAFYKIIHNRLRAKQGRTLDRGILYQKSVLESRLFCRI